MSVEIFQHTSFRSHTCVHQYSISVAGICAAKLIPQFNNLCTNCVSILPCPIDVLLVHDEALPSMRGHKFYSSFSSSSSSFLSSTCLSAKASPDASCHCAACAMPPLSVPIDSGVRGWMLYRRRGAFVDVGNGCCILGGIGPVVIHPNGESGGNGDMFWMLVGVGHL